MTGGRIERWDPRRFTWVPMRRGWSLRGVLAAVSVGGVASAALFTLLVLAPLERGLFFADALYPFEALVAMLAAVVAVDRALRGEGLLADRPMDWAVLAYAGGYALALLRHPAAPGAAMDGAFLGVALVLWYWCAGHLIRGEERVRNFAGVVYGSGVLLCVLGAAAAMGLFRFPYATLGTNRILSTLQYPNALAAWIIASSCAGFGLVQHLLEAPVSRRRQWMLAGYAAGLTAMAVILVGTYSRGGWICFVLAAAVWFAGVPKALRVEAAVTSGWAVVAGLLMSRAFLEPFRQSGTDQLAAAGAEALAFLAAGALGSIGGPAYRQIRRWVRHQRWSRRVRRALGVCAAVYGVGLLLVLGLVARRNAVASGESILGAAFGQRVATTSLQAGSAQSRFEFWGDALRLIARRPFLGYGNGGWAALYHQVQSSPYAANLVHGSLFQAWVDGGLLALAGLVALGALVLVRAWRGRGGPSGAVLWGLGAGAFGLSSHAVIDFDLSIPALALLVWAVAGTLRAPAQADAPAPGLDSGRARRVAALGLGVAGIGAVALLVYAHRLGLANRYAGFSAAAMEAGQYAAAYEAGLPAVRLDPLSASIQADQAELLAAAYSVNGVASERTGALAAAARAVALDPGNLDAGEAAVQVALELQGWPELTAWSQALLERYPLIDAAYDQAGSALLRAGEDQLLAGGAAAGRGDLTAVAAEPARYAAAASRLAGSRAAPALSAETLLAVGEADLLLGNDTAAGAVLGPLAQGGPEQGPAAAWLSAEASRSGEPTLAATLLQDAGGAKAAPLAGAAENLLAAAQAGG